MLLMSLRPAPVVLQLPLLLVPAHPLLLGLGGAVDLLDPRLLFLALSLLLRGNSRALRLACIVRLLTLLLPLHHAVLAHRLRRSLRRSLWRGKRRLFWATRKGAVELRHSLLRFPLPIIAPMPCLPLFPRVHGLVDALGRSLPSGWHSRHSRGNVRFGDPLPIITPMPLLPLLPRVLGLVDALG